MSTAFPATPGCEFLAVFPPAGRGQERAARANVLGAGRARDGTGASISPTALRLVGSRSNGSSKPSESLKRFLRFASTPA